MRGFPRPPTTNSQRRAFAQNVDFPLSFQVVREPLPFTYRNTCSSLHKSSINACRKGSILCV